MTVNESAENYLETILILSKIAAEDACKIEHVISRESFEAVKKHVKYMDYHNC